VDDMKHLRLSALDLDRRAARLIARNRSRWFERPLQWLTRGADERLLLPAVTLYWLLSRGGGGLRASRANHIFLTMVTTAIVPHLMKGVVDQERPDRCEIHGDRHGIPRSGKAFDAFPSGHAVHMGALASALSRLAPRHRILIWGLTTSLAMTRVVLLAHWLSDVVVGETLGIAIENLLHAIDRSPEA
jgi:membrane-associated phospholipid phosphatase